MISNNKGFSLIEVLISLLVMAVGVAGMVKIQLYMEVKSENALKSLDALHLSEQQLEFFLTRASVSGGVNVIHFDDINTSNCPAPDVIVPSGYSMSCTVDVMSALSSAAKTVTVETEWTDRWQNKQKVELTTIISKFSEFD
ncbi:prepilin-type N-terminal cleavage/methylation domain-containing protein [uncultured Photobacterium sp.]|uniref:type IV pilus modification PilV family protein n=1 Tax=uncultured Photobacterium sp. TaxID=173973 RepID=UPI00261FFEBD|nr:prepilin-type N-terminal cleavage/methylation domain-containing protein [uncultured Photobacterium sp.]